MERPSATTSATADTVESGHRPRTAALAVAALGIVFGDIGTSPLYTLSTCFQFSGVLPTPANQLGICSLLVWVLIVVVCFKYVAFILVGDHDGEGGILALLALVDTKRGRYAPIAAGVLTTVVIAGAAMLLRDGMITPAISVSPQSKHAYPHCHGSSGESGCSRSQFSGADRSVLKTHRRKSDGSEQ